jgi:hypothetical protein
LPGLGYVCAMAQPDILALCNEALLSLGESPIDDLEGDGVTNAVCRIKYRSIVDTLLGSHPWLFNRTILVLNRLAASPPAAAGFSAQYQLPLLCFRIICPYVSGRRVTAWEQAGSVLYLDANLSDEVALEFHTRADERLWKPAFRQAVVARLAAEFCVPVCDDTVRANALMQMAERELAKARHTNASEHPAMRLRSNKLAARRFS